MAALRRILYGRRSDQLPENAEKMSESDILVEREMTVKEVCALFCRHFHISRSSFFRHYRPHVTVYSRGMSDHSSQRFALEHEVLAVIRRLKAAQRQLVVDE